MSCVTNWSEVESDHPIPKLRRQRIQGDRMLVANVRLEKGCVVQCHHHESEQIAMIISGKVKWTIGEPGSVDYEETIVEGGNVVVLRSDVPHGVEALEDTHIIDVLSPPAPMGVDATPLTT